MADETFTVEAALQMRSNVPDVMAQVVRQFRDVNDLLKSTQEGVGRFAADLKELASGSRGINRLVAGFEKLSTMKLGGTMMADMDRMSGVMERMTVMQREMAESTQATARALREAASVRLPAPRRGGGQGAAGHGANLHAELGNVAMGLQMGGDASTGFFERSLHASFDVDHVMAVIRNDQRVTDAQESKIRALASSVVRSVPGSTVGGNLEIFNDLKNTFGDINEAMEHLGTFTRLVTTLQVMDRSHGGAGDLRQGLNTAKFIEDQGGAIDPHNPTRYDGSRFEAIAQKMIAVDIATGGRIDPAAMLAFQKQARTAGMMMDDHALYGETPYFANAFGASKLGTAFFSDLQVMLGGRLMKEHEQQLEEYGVIPKGAGHYIKTKGPNGKPKYEWEYDPRSIKDAGLLQTDGYKWIHDVLAPNIIAKEHLDVTKKPDLDRLLLLLTQMAQRGTIAGLWADVYRGYGPAQKEAANIGAQSSDALKHFMATDPTAQMMQFHAAENELMVTIGKGLTGPAIEALRALTGVLQSMSDWAKAHPGDAKTIVAVAAGMAVLAKATGDLGMVLFIGAPVVTGMHALASALPGVARGISAVMAATGQAARTAPSSANPWAVGESWGAGALRWGGKVAGVLGLGLLGWEAGQGAAVSTQNYNSSHTNKDDAFSRYMRGESVLHATINVNVDGKKVQTTTAKVPMGVQSGTTGHDGSMGLYPAGLPAGGG